MKHPVEIILDVIILAAALFTLATAISTVL